MLKKEISATAQKASDIIHDLQNQICSSLESLDPEHPFHEDRWSRGENRGGGITRVLEGGKVFEKGGVNTSVVFGELKSDEEKGMFSQLLAQQGVTQSLGNSSQFYATGISLVIHPRNPQCPTTHLNYRYFELQSDNGLTVWWFGGGADLTPYILNKDQATHFHAVHKKACDALDPTYYPLFKGKCDNYFYLSHRKEHRGIGGIFFDYLNSKDPEHYLSLIRQCGEAFIPAYLPIIQENHPLSYTEAEKNWQEYRRGRYVEFNLLFDRGTLFGLKTGGRIESILMSLPPHCQWAYMDPDYSEQENELMSVIKTPINWI